MPKTKRKPLDTQKDDLSQQLDAAEGHGFEPQYSNKRLSPWPHSYRRDRRYVLPCHLEGKGKAGWRSCNHEQGRGFQDSQYHETLKGALERPLD